jgi:hypothetical protein
LLRSPRHRGRGALSASELARHPEVVLEGAKLLAFGSDDLLAARVVIVLAELSLRLLREVGLHGIVRFGRERDFEARVERFEL